MNEKVLAVFQNRTQALTFSRALNRIGVKTKIINTPRELSASCGLSVQFEYKNFNKIRNSTLLMGAGSFMGFYLNKSVGGLTKYIRL